MPDSARPSEGSTSQVSAAQRAQARSADLQAVHSRRDPEQALRALLAAAEMARDRLYGADLNRWGDDLDFAIDLARGALDA